MLLYNVDVHMYFPATIGSPGYIEENKTKPAITLKIEESDGVATPDACAEGLFQGTYFVSVSSCCPGQMQSSHIFVTGIQRGDFHITDSFTCDLFRTTARGATPWNNVFKDLIYGFIGLVRVHDRSLMISHLTPAA